jgi:uncharacterized protein (DUF1800 family)
LEKTAVTMTSPSVSQLPSTTAPTATSNLAPLALAGLAAGLALAEPAAAATLAPGDAPLTTTQAARLLSQGSMGHSRADITALTGSTANAWLNAQFALPRSGSFWKFLMDKGFNASVHQFDRAGALDMMWPQLMTGNDVLRQRVGMALLSQWVVGIYGLPGGAWRQFALARYLDHLWNYAFGNYRDLMEAVTTSTAMGLYLTYLGSTKASTAGSIPDENYAREIMQLFTIGLYELNMDGTQVLVGGKPVPTYTQTDVSQLARVFTGYTWPTTYDWYTPGGMADPMIVTASTHETGASTFLSVTVPANTDAAKARKIALDTLFYHPNTAPFLARQLIQHMVTSNPSPAYVYRVATAFANNGSGVRGDMKAVIRAVLTDAEARSDASLATSTGGKLREPIMRLAQWVRACNVTSPSGIWPFSDETYHFGQSPGVAPSVFNYFRPNYTPPGTAIAAAGLVAGEFQITDEPHHINYINEMQYLIDNGRGDAKPDYTTFVPLAVDSQWMLNEMNLIFASNQISSNTITQMKAVIDTLPATNATQLTTRVRTAMLLIFASSEYLVQR